MLKIAFLVGSAGTEIECHLGYGRKKKKKEKKNTQLKYSNKQKTVTKLLRPVLSSYLHGSGTHVREDFFSGAGILVIANSCMNAPLQEQNTAQQNSNL